MLSDDVFDREKKLFTIIAEEVRKMIKNGYEVRIFDKAQETSFEFYFVEPAGSGKSHPEVRRLVLPHQFVSLLVEGDVGKTNELLELTHAVEQAGRNLNGFMKDLFVEKMDEWSGMEKDYRRTIN